jgi:hypothetical protein
MEEHGTVVTARFTLRHKKVEVMKDIEATLTRLSHERGDGSPMMPWP